MSNLRVQGNVSGSGTITLVTPNTNSTYEVLLPAAGGSIAVGPQGSTGQIQYNSSGVFAGNVNLTFDGSVLYVGGSQRLRAAATGSTANGFQLDAGAQAHYWYLADNTNSVYEIGSTAGAWRWQNSLGERLRINSNGALVLAGGATAADGVGIAFPATQSASSNANTLDDYEEGTWTPTASGASGSGTADVANGWYVKIGRMVTLNIGLHISSKGTLSGQIYINNLPFAPITTGAYSHFSGAIAVYASGNSGASIQAIVSNTGTTQIYFVFNNAGSTVVNWSDVGSTPAFFGTLTYQVA